MAKKKDNTLIYIGAAAVILYFLFKKPAPAGAVRRKIEKAKEDIDNTKFTAYIDREDYFKKQYKDSLNACSY